MASRNFNIHFHLQNTLQMKRGNVEAAVTRAYSQLLRCSYLLVAKCFTISLTVR